MEKPLSLILRKGLILSLLLLFWLPIAVAAADDEKSEAAPEVPALPDTLTADDVDRIVAGLSDEQARRLLIDALQREAALDTAAAAEDEEGADALIEGARSWVRTLQSRVDYLRSGGTQHPDEVSGMFTFLGIGEKSEKNPAAVIASVIAVLAAGLLLQALFFWYSVPGRRRLASTAASRWRSKLGVLATRTLLDVLGICLFALGTLVTFFLFLEGSTGQRVLVATYVVAIGIVQLVSVTSQFLLAPRNGHLRLFPITDETAQYLHRWILALAVVFVFGFFTCGVVRVAGATELEHLKATTAVALVMGAMIIWMILQKRAQVAAFFSRGVPEKSLRFRLAQRWHVVGVFGTLLLLAMSTLNDILGLSGGKGTLTLLMVPLYFLLDWMLRRALDAIFGIVETPGPAEDVPDASATAASDAATVEAKAEESAESAPESGPPGIPVPAGRMKEGLRSGLRLALAALLVFWTLRIWGISPTIGEALAAVAFRILLVVLIGYVLLAVVNAFIQRRLDEELPQDGEEEEMEEGGAGGSRIVTLLILLRKFLTITIVVIAGLMILSALGVNIGPLIAGAGVIGLAIGFGAQTLVKDIISGVFFLIDDAFRVGDYVQVAGTKGTVEQISIRSLRLRHPRGQVNFIPFGDIATVTNLSRDYIITKLDFRVRYDTDVEKVRKIIKKKVYKEIMKDPELANKLLDKIKSQGVREMDDSAMIMRVKYKTRPGDQFVIRKHVYQLMREAFQEAGIEFAHRNVTVYMPPEVQQALARTDADTRKKAVETAAGAAIAAVHADEEKQAQETKGKKSP